MFQRCSAGLIGMALCLILVHCCGRFRHVVEQLRIQQLQEVQLLVVGQLRVIHQLLLQRELRGQVHKKAFQLLVNAIWFQEHLLQMHLVPQ